ncbi:MAG: 2-oxoacid:acceptor oxidoreductase family protein [Chloroflexota bacterium]|nr:2-oxoacid:acceptor oxidoreductase family protein [Chloroflexota bacterium]
MASSIEAHMDKDSDSRFEIRIAGFGGQGVILSGQIMGKAASIYDKGFATMTQSYGPEARGGSCAAEVVISQNPIDYPYVTSPQVVVILAQEAYTNYGRNPSTDTLVIIDPDLVNPDPFQTPPPLSVPATRMAQEMGRTVVANIIVLGFLSAVSNLVSVEALRKAVLASVPEGTGEFNLKAFDLGRTYGLEQERRNTVGGK